MCLMDSVAAAVRFGSARRGVFCVEIHRDEVTEVSFKQPRCNRVNAAGIEVVTGPSSAIYERIMIQHRGVIPGERETTLRRTPCGEKSLCLFSTRLDEARRCSPTCNRRFGSFESGPYSVS